MLKLSYEDLGMLLDLLELHKTELKLRDLQGLLR